MSNAIGGNGRIIMNTMEINATASWISGLRRILRKSPPCACAGCFAVVTAAILSPYFGGAAASLGNFYAFEIEYIANYFGYSFVK